MSSTWLSRSGLVLMIIAIFCQAVVAEDIEKKWRVGLSVGGYNTQDEIASDAANRLFILDEQGLVEDLLFDPRNDDAALGTLSVEPAPRYLGSVQYAVNKILVLEASVGYQTGDVGEVEIQAQFEGVEVPEGRDFNFSIHRIPVGTLEQIPIQLSAIARFRPRANFNPFLGAGVGYTIVGFEPTSEFDNLSRLMDSSLGNYAPINGTGTGLDIRFEESFDLSGAHVLAPDTVEWHLLGGAEYSFKRKWAAFVELRYLFAARQFSIRFNETDSLGFSVPNGVVDQGTPGSFPSEYGGWFIADGGLVDAGMLVPEDPSDVPPGMTDFEYCYGQAQTACEFVEELDGLPDPGTYYVKGGDIKYGGFHLGFGVRFTF